MKTYISILRGINVGGKNPVNMNSLQEMYEKLGFKNVKTYIQSGNVVFQSTEMPTEEIERVISDEIFIRFTLSIPVIVRENSALRIILEQNPFLRAKKEDIDGLYITLLATSPVHVSLNGMGNNSFLPDQYVIKGREIYLSCPNGYGKTKLSNNFFESKLKVKATTRNLKTLTELVKLGDVIENSPE